jgi:hypothetical protein
VAQTDPRFDALFADDRTAPTPQVDPRFDALFAGPEKPAGFFEGTKAAIESGFGRLAGTAVRGLSMAGATLARGAEYEAQAQQQNDAIMRGIDIGAGKAGDYPDDTLSQALIGAGDRLATHTEEYWQPKAGQKMGMGAKITAGIATVGGFPLTYALNPAERAAEILKAGGSQADAYKAAGTDAAFEAAMVLAGGGAGTALTKAGAGPIASTVGGAAAGAGLNVGIAAAQPAVEKAVAPGIPEAAKMQQPGAEELTVAGLVGAAGGAHGAKAERAQVQERQVQERIAARSDWDQLSPADQARVVAGETPQADQAKAAAKAHGIDTDNVMHDMAAAARKGGIQEIEGAPAPTEEGPGAVENIKGAPAPKEAAPTGGEPRAPEEQITAGPVKSPRQMELERLRELAGTPEAQAHLDKAIKAEQAVSQKAWDEEEKARQGAQAATDLRRLAGQSQDPALREELLAKADKLSPETKAAEGETEAPKPETKGPEAGTVEPAVETAAAPRVHTTGSSPFFQRIADELGGIHTSERSDAGFDRLKAVLIGGKKPNGKARGPLFTNAGAKMDRFVEWLQGRGYLTDADVEHADANMVGGSHELARDLLQREKAQPGSVTPIRDQSDRWAGIQERQRQDWLMQEADRLGVTTQGRTLDSIERDIHAAQDHEHAQAHGHEPEHLADLADVRKATDIDEGAVERMAIQHGEDLAGFKAAIKEFLNANQRAEPVPERHGAEPRPGGEAQQPAVRGEHPPAAEVRGEPHAVRGEQGAGGGGPGERAAGGPPLPGAGAERGGAAAAETGDLVKQHSDLSAAAQKATEAFDRKWIAAQSKKLTPEQSAKLQAERVEKNRLQDERNAAYDELARRGVPGYESEEERRATPQPEGEPRERRTDLSRWEDDRLQRMSDLTGRRIKEEQANLEEQEAKAARRTLGESNKYALERSKDRIAEMTSNKAEIDAELANRAAVKPPQVARFETEIGPLHEKYGSLDEAEAAGQGEAYHRETMDSWRKQSDRTLQQAQAQFGAHVDRIKAFLDRKGLGWVHKIVDYAVSGDVRGVAQVRMLNGRYKLDASPDLMRENQNVIDQAMLHEHGHIIDWSGQLYSADPAMEVGHDARGKITPIGPVAKELFALAKSNKDMGRLMDYPMHEVYGDLHRSPYEFQSELFAQSVVAYHTALREAMENEAPQAAKFMADSLAHASQHGEAPRVGAEGTTKLAELRASFDAGRSAGGFQQRGPGEPGGAVTERLERPLSVRSRQADDAELKQYRDILSRSYSPDQLKRMGEASKEEDAMLASGKTDPAKGLASLPPDQREVMEFLQGRGYDRRLLPYTPYEGVAQRPAEGGGAGGIGDAVAKVLAPFSRGEIAAKQAGIMRANFGEMARERELALQQLRDHAARYADMTPAKQIAFTDAVERGRMLPDSKMAQDAKVLRQFYDTKRDEIRELGTGALEHFNENYVGHAWTEPDRATNDLYSIRRPIEGSKAFLQKRTIPYTTDGLRWRAYDGDGYFIKSFDSEGEAKAAVDEAGGGRVGKPLTPLTTNPFEMALIKGREMDRYLYGQRIFKEMQMSGLARFVPYGREGQARAAGMVPINDKIARTREQAMSPEGKPLGPVQSGQWHAPDEAATLINNHLSPGMRGNSAYEFFRRTGNMLNQAQLGLSLFHVGFTTMDTVSSRLALGLKQVSRGDIGAAIPNIAMGATPLALAQPFVNIYKGDRLLRAYLGKLDDPDLAPIVAAIQDAGGRVRMDDFYRNVEVNAFKNALHNGQVLTAARHFIPTVLDRVNAPIFEQLVPRQKLGVFFDMAKDWLAKNPEAGVDLRRQELGKLWDSVDNRMGQLVYDNLFWNKALKDSLMIGVRSVGWNLGTIRELGGGVKDMLNVKDLASGKGISDRTAYLLAMPMVAAIVGAVTQYAYTGKGPQEAKDYFFPKTGRTRADGSPDRVSPPSYMKDVAAYAKDVTGFVKYGSDPFQTFENKLHPLLSTIAQMAHNEDFFGAAIRNPADSGVRQLQDEAEYLLKQVEPFSVRNYQQQQAAGGQPANPLGWATSPSMFGMTPSPGYITKTPEQQEQAEIGRLREPLMRKFREELQAGGNESDVIDRAYKSGLTKRDIEYVIRSSGPTPMPHRPRQFGTSP